VVVLASAVALAYALALASTRPFTAPADALTAVGLAAGVVALSARLIADRRAIHGVAPAGPGRAVRAWLPWVGLLAAVAGWELYCYVGGPRPAHPTLSSLYDLAARYRLLKAAIVLAWLALGWELVRP
jgi:hypothetical protein